LAFSSNLVQLVALANQDSFIAKIKAPPSCDASASTPPPYSYSGELVAVKRVRLLIEVEWSPISGSG